MGEASNPIDSMSSRAVGFLMLAAGAVLCYVGVVSPLLALRRGAESISLYMAASGITPLALGIGSVYTLFGERAERILGHPQRPTRTSWILCAVLTVVGLALHFWLKAQLADHGYSS